jgi:hypothetical protein
VLEGGEEEEERNKGGGEQDYMDGEEGRAGAKEEVKKKRNTFNIFTST